MTENIGKYLWVEEMEQPKGRKTKRWSIMNDSAHDELGEISWYSPWRQYTVTPGLLTVWNSQCLDDLSAFLQKINKGHRDKLSGG